MFGPSMRKLRYKKIFLLNKSEIFRLNENIVDLDQYLPLDALITIHIHLYYKKILRSEDYRCFDSIIEVIMLT